MIRKKILNILLACFTSITILLCGFILFLTTTHTKAYAVQSNSMSPAFNAGDAVFVRPGNTRDLKAGDIITVRSLDGRRYFTHRITRVDLEESIVYTKGDNNSSEDPMPADISLIAGRVWFSIPNIGNLSFAMQNRTFLILLALIVISLVFVRVVFLAIKKTKKGGGRDAA